MKRLLLSLSLSLAAVTMSSAQVVQTYYVPLADDSVREANFAVENTTNFQVLNVISIAVGLTNTVVYYDHWEDGFENDLQSPVQSTTEIWGDGNAANGIPPGFATDFLNSGNIIALQSTNTVPRVATTVAFDGRDKFAVSKPVAVSRAAWNTNPGTVLAGACEVLDRKSYGDFYTAPVGTDTINGNNMFEYCAFSIMGAFDNTTVEVDTDADGTPDVTQVIDEGEYMLVTGIAEGATITASRVVQTHIIAGEIEANYESRYFTLFPTAELDSEYIMPIDSAPAANNDNTRVFVHNPSTNSITLFYEVTGAVTNSFTITANTTGSFIMPENTGARLFTTNAAPFSALAVVDDGASGGNVHDWGMTLVPLDALTPVALVGWGPGSTTPLVENSAPVWVTAVSNTTLYVDYDADPSTGPYTDPSGYRYDTNYTVNALQQLLIYDTSDGDQTGIRLYTLDSTKIATAWGQDPATASNGAPALDMGTTVLPFPPLTLTKSSGILDDKNNNGFLDPGETIEFTLAVVNEGFVTANDVEVRDAFDTNEVVYVTNTTFYVSLGVTNNIPDDLSPDTPFPLDNAGYNIGSLSVFQTALVTYVFAVADPFPPDGDPIVNEASVGSQEGSTGTDLDVPVNVAKLAISKVSDTAVTLYPGETNTYTIVVSNLLDSVVQENVTVTDLLPTGVTYVAASAEIITPIYTTNNVADNFENIAFTNNLGSVDWLAPWTEIGEADGANAGDIALVIETVGRRLRIQDNDNGGEGVRRGVNLDGALEATLSYVYRRTNLDDINDYATVDVSTNGTTWIELARYSANNDATYIAASIDISGYATTNTRVRFLSSANMGGADQVYFDDVDITYVTRTVVTNSASGPSNMVTAADAYDLFPGETMTLTFQVTVDSPVTNTQLVNSVFADSDQQLEPPSATATNSAALPSIDVQKTVYLGHDSGASCPGVELVQGTNTAAVTYCFDVTNTGNIVLTNVVIDDPALGISNQLVTNMLTNGQTASFYYETTITGDLTNTVTASGTDPRGTTTNDTDTAEVDLISPSLTVGKTVYLGHDSGASCPGGELVQGTNTAAVTYCFEVANTGDVTLTNVVVDDAALGVSGLTVTNTLATGQTVTIYYETTLTNDLVNTATVTGEDPNGDPTDDDDTAEVDEINPSLILAKTVYLGHDSGASCPGTELVQGTNTAAVTYCFEVTNTGDVTLTNVVVDDALLGLSGLTVTNILATGQTATVYVETNVFGDVLNTATATGEDPNGDTTDDDDTAEVDEITPALGLQKTVYLGHDSGAACPGVELVQATNTAAITYCFEVTNLGDVALTNVVVNDAALGVVNLSVTNVLGVGQTATTYVEDSVSGDLPNTATATGEDPNGDPTEDDDTAGVDEINPALDVQKTVYLGHDSGASCPGVDVIQGTNTTAITYCFDVSNTGDVTLTNVVIDDALLGLSGLLVTNTLAAGQTASVYVETNATGDVTNTVTATGEDPNGDPTDDDDTAEVDEINPGLVVQKTVYLGHDSGASCPGVDLIEGTNTAAITYCFEVSNTGDVTLTNVVVDDATLGLSGVLVTNALATGQTATIYVETNVTGDVTNTVTATGEDPNGDPTDDDDTAEVDEINPGLVVQKTVYLGHDSGASCPGVDLIEGTNTAAVTYCFEVTNTGDVTLTNVVVNDPALGFNTIATNILATGETVTVYSEETVTNDLVNTATATGEDPNGDPTDDDDTAEVDEINPGLVVQKTVYLGHDSGASCPGIELVSGTNATQVTYCFEVTNTGDVTLTNVVVDDAALGLTGQLVTNTLATGQTATLYREDTITADLVNTATATGEDPNGDPTDDDDTAEVDEIAPAIDIQKTVYLGHDSGAGCPGVERVQGTNTAAVTYCFEVTNTGDVTLTNVVVDDASLGVVALPVTNTLATGQTVTVYYEDTISGDLVNTATASGIDPLGDTYTDDDTAEVDEIAPALDVQKTVYLGHDSGASCPGAELVQGTNTAAVTYCFEVTNTGDVTLTNVVIDDATLGITGQLVTNSLATGQTVTVYSEETVSGDVTNTVTATGEDPNGDPTDDDDTAEVDEIAPAINVEKTVYSGHDSGASCPGVELVEGTNATQVTYCFEVTNAGDVTLTNVVVDDADLGLSGFAVTNSLVTGQTVTVYYESSITNDLVNTASATGEDPNSDAYTDSDTAEVDEVAPSIDIQKTVYIGHDAGASCPGSELVSVTNGAAVTYCFVVTNTGDVPLDSVSISDVTVFPPVFTLPVSIPAGGVVTNYAERFMVVDLVNTAGVAGVYTPLGINVNDEDTAEVQEINPALDIQKTVYLGHDSGAGCPGVELVQGTNTAAITYCFEVSNVGNVTLTNVVVDDAALGISGLPVTNILSTGQTVTVFVETNVTGDVLNTATATGEDPNGDPTDDDDTAEVDEMAPALDIQKTVYLGHDSGTSCPGVELVSSTNAAAVTYCFEVTNTGDVTLTNVVVDDATLGVVGLPVTNSLATGQTVTVYYEDTIAADLVNTATATGEDPNGDSYNDNDTAEVEETTPAIDIQKTVYLGHDSGASCPGVELVQGTNTAAVTYCFEVTNTGNVTLTNVVVDDASLGVVGLPVTNILATGQTVTVYFEDTLAGGLVNTATATGEDNNGDTFTDNDTAEVDEIAPAIEVQKTVYLGHDSGASCPGVELVQGTNTAAVTYCFEVTNTGDVTLTNVVVDDASLSVVGLPVTNSLATGQTVTVYFEDTVSSDLVNTATATGEDPNGDPTEDDDTAEVDEINPALDIQKTVYAGHDSGVSCPGVELVSGTNSTQVTYCFEITNTGDVTLTNVVVDDATLGILGQLVTNTLATGQTVTVYIEDSISVDLVNTATGTGEDPNGDPTDDDDTAEVNEIAPSIDIQKTVYLGHDGGASCPGVELVQGTNTAAVTYCFEVTNTGDVTLTNVVVDDATLGVVALPVTNTLVTGQTVTVYYEDTITSDLLNTATASGIDPLGDTYTDDDTAEVDEIAPAIDVQKTVYLGHDSGASCPGVEVVQGTNTAAVTYCFEVTNTGDVTLTNVVIDDATLGIAGQLVTNSLATGETVTVFTEETVAGDVTNTVTATGEDPNGDPTDDDDTAEVDEIAPALDIQKTVYSGHDSGASCPGVELVQGTNATAVTYCFEVTNQGDVTLTNVVVDDADLGLSGFAVTNSLATGQTATVYYEASITNDLVNTAAATGEDPNGDLYTDNDTAEVDEVAPSIDIQKTVYIGHDAGASCPGVELVSVTNAAAVTYCFVVTNTGDVALDNVTVSDVTVLPPAFVGFGTIPPGGVVTNYVDRFMLGDLVNTADVSGVYTPLGINATDSDTAEVQEIIPAIDIQKTVYLGHDSGAGCPGVEVVQGTNTAAVTYCFGVSNIGNATLTNVVVDDADLGVVALPVTNSLATGQTVTVYYESTITNALVNTATATGEDVNGDTYTDDDTAEVVRLDGGIDLQKTVYLGHDSGASCPGVELVQGTNTAAVTYCFEVTNTGNATLTNVVIDDAALGLAGFAVTNTLATGQTVTVYYESTITADLLNTATVTGEDPVGNPIDDDDTAEVDEISPAIDIQKTVYAGHDSGSSCPGTELVQGTNTAAVTYCFEVTNTGDVTLTNVVIDDADLGIAGQLVTNSLATGQTATVYVENTITADLVNTATATGEDPNGDPTDDDDTAEVDEIAPAIDIQKTVYLDHDSGASCPGVELVQGTNTAAVTYCFEVTNTGDVTLTNVVVDDAALGVVAQAVTNVLATGETVTVYFEGTITGDLVNTAIATGLDPVGDAITDDDTAEVDEIAPAIEVQKTVYAGHDSGAGCPGVELVLGTNTTAVTYCFEVTNTGDVTLTNVVIDDPALGLAGVPVTNSLATGQTVTVYSEDTIAGDLVNTATATGEDPNGDPTNDDDTAEVDEIAPAIDIQKTVYAGHDSGASCPGVELVQGTNTAAVTYCFEVTNTGDVTLTNVVVNDATLGVVGLPVTNTLATGQTVTVYVEDTITGDLVNTATATGLDPVGDAITDDDTAEVDEIGPEISIAKTVYLGHDSGASCPGVELVQGTNTAAVTYCFEVTNTGDVTLTNVVVDDAALGVVGQPVTNTLATGETVTVYFEGTIASDLVNTATATGVDPVGDPVTDDDTAEVDEIAPAIDVQKTVYLGHDSGASCPGVELVQGTNTAAVTYCFEVTNTGDVTLTNVVVDDATLGIAGLTVTNSLATGQTVTVYVEDTITSDLVNTATATGEDPNGDPTDDDDTAEVDEIAPAIDIQKTVYAGHDSGASCPGVELVQGTNTAAVTYCFEVTNTGDVTLTNVVVNDATLGIAGLPVTNTLATGQTVTVYVEDTITGDLVNTATATGEDPNGDPSDDDDTAEVDEIAPAIDIQKTVYLGHDSGASCPGVELVQGTNTATVTYCFEVTNTGDVTLTNVVVDDAALGVVAQAVTNVLATGETVTVYYEGTIASDLVNTATATGVDPVGDPVTDDDTAEVDEIAPAIDVQKTVYLGHDSGASCPGVELVQGTNTAAVTYCFEVTNTGDVTLTNVVIDDPALGLAGVSVTNSLATGQTVTVFSEETITGDLVNTATATGEDPNGDPTDDDDNAEVDEIAPAIDIQKTVYEGHDSGASCPGVELVTSTNSTPVTYCFEVTNTGDVTLTNVVVDDATLGVVGQLITNVLATGQTVTVYVEDTITSDLVNTATATGEDPNGDPADDDDTAEVDEIAPAIDIQKTVYLGHDSGASCPGVELVQGTNTAAVTYCFEVTNTGDVTLTNVVVDDATLGVVALPVTNSLATGETVTVYFEDTITADLVNTATASGLDPVGDTIADDDTAEVDEIAPALDVQKTVYLGHDSGASCPGVELVQGTNTAAVTYCFEVTNTGDVTLTNVVIDDPTLGIVGQLVTNTLATGETVTVYSEETISGDVTNTVTATGEDPNGDPTDDDDTAEVDEIAPALEIQKTVYVGHDSGASCPGVELVQGTNTTQVTYCFEVTNTGDVALTNVVVDDPALGVAGQPVTNVLATGQTVTVYFEGTITADLVNTATATGEDPNGDPADDDDTAEVDEIAPAIDIQKTVYLGHDSGASCPGVELVQGTNTAAVTYCFEVTNTGDVTLTNVVVDDATLGVVALPVTNSLATGETVNVYYEDTITADLVNTATASGLDPVGDTIADDDTAEVDEIAPALDVQKTVYLGHDSGASCPGVELVQGTNAAAVTYCFEVTNTGDVTLTNVVIDDPTLGIAGQLVTNTLATGETVTVYSEETISGDVTNTVTATGEDPNGDPTDDDDTAEVDEIAPAIDIQKTVYVGHDSGASCPGVELVQGTNTTQVTYCFEVTNIGDVALTNVVVDDPALGVAGQPVTNVLATGQTVTVYFEDTITADLVNTATATGEDPNGDPADDDDTAEVDEIAPAIDIQKTVYLGHDSGASCPGVELVQGTNTAAVTYCFEVTNTGDVTLTNVVVDDATLGVVALPVTNSLTTGETVTVYYEDTITTDLVNTATASGLDPVGDTIADDDTAEVDEIAPALDVQKTVYLGHDSGASCPGVELVQGTNTAAVTYCFEVTNTGDVTLTNVVIDDPTLGIVGQLVTNTLATGQTVTVFTEETVAGDVTNTVTATGEDPNGDPTDDDDTAEVDEIAPALEIQKTVYVGHDSGASCPGVELVQGTNTTQVTYCFEVTNTGDVTLTNVVIDDGALGLAGVPVTNTLATGQTVTVYVEDTITADLVNTATATGEDPNGDPSEDDDTAEVDEIAPAIDIQKTVYLGHDSGASCPGVELVQGTNTAAVTYCFEVTNTGDVTLTNVVVDDADLGLSGFAVTNTLATGQTVTVYIESTLAGDLVNTATASGIDPVGDTVNDDDTAEVDEIAPAIDIQKTVYVGHDSGASCPGVELVSGTNTTQVTYCFEVTNTGDVTLTNVVVDDVDLGLSGFPVTNALATGQTVTVYVEDTIAADLVNTATAVGEDPNGDTTEDDDTAEVNEIAPAIGIQKTVYLGHDSGASCPGIELVQGTNTAAVTYCFEVTNTGDVTLTNVVVDDPSLGIAGQPVTNVLATGQTVTVYVEAAIAGDLVNTATASGIDPVGDTYTDDDTAAVDEIAPALDIQKTVYLGHDSGASCPGVELVQGTNTAAVTYCFEVTNTGDVTLTNVVVDDATLGVAGLLATNTLATGQTVTVYIEDAILGDLVNTATATGEDPNSDPYDDDDTAEVDEITPSLDIQKTVYLGHDSGASCPGVELAVSTNNAAVTYCFEVTNTGDVTLTNVVVDDPSLAIVGLPVTNVLATGQTVTVYSEENIAGDLVNTAGASGEDPNGDSYTDDDTAEVDEVLPGIAIAKTVYLGTDGGASCPGTELVINTNGAAVTYCFEITNTGDTELLNVTVSDALISPVLNQNLGTLAPGASITTHVDSAISGDLTNTASVVGTPGMGGSPLTLPDVTDDDTAEVDEVLPGIEIAKTVYLGHDSGASCPGIENVISTNAAAVTYCFEITNTGDTELLDVTINDLLVSPSLSTNLGTLAIGGSVTAILETTISGDLTNLASVVGTPGSGGTPLVIPDVTDDDTASVDQVGPGINIEKTVYIGHDSGASCPGGESVANTNGVAITYCFEITNTGDTYLAPVTLSDTDVSPVVNSVIPILAPGQTVTQILETVISGSLTNTAGVAGTPADSSGTSLGLPDVTDDDTAVVIELFPVTVGDFVWDDLNADGIQDFGEPGIPGVTVYLQDTNGVTVASNVTDGAGMFSLVWLPGIYQVQFDLATLPTNYFLTVTNAGPDNVDSDADASGLSTRLTIPLVGNDQDLDIDMGAWRPVRLGDDVFFDVNNNGVPEPGEPGIEGAEVNLYQIVGSVTNFVGMRTTDPDGVYDFGFLPPGTYLVEIDLSTVDTGIEMLPTTPTTYLVVLSSGMASDVEDFGFIVDPTYIELVSFTATPQENGVLVEWVTGSEVDNLGFNVYRSQTEDGPREQVNTVLILGQGTGTGQAYELLDTGASDGPWYYWLEDVEFDFDTKLHGPVYVYVGYGDIVGTFELSEPGAYAAEVDNPAQTTVLVDGDEVASLAGEGELIFYVPAGDVTVELVTRENPLRMQIINALPEAGLEVNVIVASEERSTWFSTGEVARNYFVTGFVSEPVLLDITNPLEPKLLNSTIFEMPDQTSLYMSYGIRKRLVASELDE